MPKERIPLVGVHNQRTIDAQGALVAEQDQQFVNCVFGVVRNPITGKATFYLEKRPGWGVQAVVSAGSVSTGLIRSEFTGTVVSAWGDTNSTIFDASTSIGTITGKAIHFSETFSSGTGIGFILIRSSDGTGWYYASNAADQVTYTGDTHTNTTIDGIASTAGMYSGQAISGTGIQAGTRILTVDSGTAITTDTATTATANGVTITKTPIAKILDADFVTTGSTVSALVEMDGFIFYVAADGFVYHSDLNSVSSYSALSKIPTNISPDLPLAIFRHNNLIGVASTGSMEFFYNAGNGTGSVLSRAEQHFKSIGIQNQRSLARLGDDIYFASSSKDGDVQIMRLRGSQPQPISTPEIDRILGTASALSSDIHLSAFQLGGYSYLAVVVISSAAIETSFLLMDNHDFLLLDSGDKIILSADTSAATGVARILFYNITLNIWSEWDSTVMTYVRGGGTGSLNKLISTSRLNTDGKIYLINPSGQGAIFSDDGAAYTSSVRTSPVDFGTDNIKFVISIALIGDIQDEGEITLEKSDDDYATWQTLGTFDLTVKNPTIARCGSHRGGRAYRLTHTGTGPFRAQALDIEYEVGQH